MVLEFLTLSHHSNRAAQQTQCGFDFLAAVRRAPKVGEVQGCHGNPVGSRAEETFGNARQSGMANPAPQSRLKLDEFAAVHPGAAVGENELWS